MKAVLSFPRNGKFDDRVVKDNDEASNVAVMLRASKSTESS